MINFIIETIKYYPIWSAVAIIISSVAMFFAILRFWKLFNILFTFTTKISNLKPGKVEIKGRVKAVNSVDGLEKKSVYYKKIEEYYKKGHKGKGGTWKEESRSEEYVFFRVVDDTGEITVIPKSKDDFDIKHVVIPGMNNRRTKYFYLDDNEEVYVLGYLFKNHDGYLISKKEGIPFIISDFKESKLIIKHGFYSLGITILVVVGISIMLSFASKEWNKSWEGVLEGRYTYVSGSGKSKTTHYMFELKGNKTVETNRREYNRAFEGNHLVKHKKRYSLEINDF
jgi:hypothetical protein